jgi:alpha-acetolactate decarboxylase
MTHEKLVQAVDLSKQITELERIIQNGKTQTCEWIEFTFGNGSNSTNVCNDKDIIQKIRDLVVSENEIKLIRLKKEFSEL